MFFERLLPLKSYPGVLYIFGPGGVGKTTLVTEFAAISEEPYTACHRAVAMVHSDRWVNEGHVANSPLLSQNEEESFQSYQSLRQAVAWQDSNAF